MKFDELKEKGLIVKEYVINNKVISIVLGVSILLNMFAMTSCSNATDKLELQKEETAKVEEKYNNLEEKYNNLYEQYKNVTDKNRELNKKVEEARPYFEQKEEEERKAKEEEEQKAKEEEEKEAQEIQDESLNEEVKNGEYQLEDNSDNDVKIIETLAEEHFGKKGYDYKVYKQNDMIVLQIKLDNSTLASGQYYMSEWNTLVDTMVQLSGSASGVTSCKFVVSVTDYSDNCYITAMDGVLYIDVFNGINKLN